MAWPRSNSVSNKAGKVYGYEVAIIKVQPSETILGKVIPEREVYPRNEDFGTYGWYYPQSHLEDAEAKSNGLLNSIPDLTPSET
jgi:hypothetical protein